MTKLKGLIKWIALCTALCAAGVLLILMVPSVGITARQTGIYQLFHQITPVGLVVPLGAGQLIMMGVCLVLLYLGIVKKFEPLLLVPMAVGGILSNIPGTGLTEAGGLL
ncbi:MAG: sodium ion-translocating decarboxylase subunit beta, partial [Alphaproteobacteria bacterium]